MNQYVLNPVFYGPEIIAYVDNRWSARAVATQYLPIEKLEMLDGVEWDADLMGYVLVSGSREFHG